MFFESSRWRTVNNDGNSDNILQNKLSPCIRRKKLNGRNPRKPKSPLSQYSLHPGFCSFEALFFLFLLFVRSFFRQNGYGEVWQVMSCDDRSGVQQLRSLFWHCCKHQKFEGSFNQNALQTAWTWVLEDQYRLQQIMCFVQDSFVVRIIFRINPICPQNPFKIRIHIGPVLELTVRNRQCAPKRIW